MSPRLLWFVLGAIGGASLLFGQEALGDWADRFARWTAVRDADSPVRNAIHLRQELAINNLFGLQTRLYVVPANRRLLIEQVAAYCNFGAFSGARLDQLHVASAVGGVAARYPIVRFGDSYGRDFLAGPVRIYADAEAPVFVNLVFSHQTNAVCEVTATGQLVQMAP